MKRFDDLKINTVVLAFAGVLVLGGGANADYVFDPAENLGPVINGALHDAGAGVSSDGLELWFSRHVTWNENNEWWMSTRATKDAPWDAPVNYGKWDDSHWNLIDTWGCITTPDRLELYFNDVLPGGYGGSDLWFKTRATIDSEWGPPVNLGPVVNSPHDEIWPALSPDGLEMYFSGFSATNPRPGGQGNSDLWVTRRATRNDPWGEPVNLGSIVNSPAGDWRPHISRDGLVLFFDSYRSGGSGESDLYMTRRPTTFDPWGPPVNLGRTINSPQFEECAFLSADGSTLYFDSGRPGGYGGHDIWQVPILLIVDFNGDGKVDGKDVLCMAGNWDTDDPVCDIGPLAWGDGVVDLNDLVVLTEHLGTEVIDPTLAAHWKLDEAEGMITRESVGGDDSYVLGDAAWEPVGGQVDGAIMLDGVDDCVVAGFVLDPAEGPFSALAWVKGGAPGQVVVSEPTGANWLMADAEGRLMTELTAPGRDGAALQSQTIITDGQWHRIGFVWDGFRRMLYCDGVIAAEDLQDTLKSSGSGQYIGAGHGMEPGAFWSGSIDDVRIYNRAVRP